MSHKHPRKRYQGYPDLWFSKNVDVGPWLTVTANVQWRRQKQPFATVSTRQSENGRTWMVRTGRLVQQCNSLEQVLDTLMEWAPGARK